MYEKVSTQSCAGGTKDSQEENKRMGEKAFYAFVYPNFMINRLATSFFCWKIIFVYVNLIYHYSLLKLRYGPWMDTNLVLPMGPRKCQVIFDYFLDASLAVSRIAQRYILLLLIILYYLLHLFGFCQALD